MHDRRRNDGSGQESARDESFGESDRALPQPGSPVVANAVRKGGASGEHGRVTRKCERNVGDAILHESAAPSPTVEDERARLGITVTAESISANRIERDEDHVSAAFAPQPARRDSREQERSRRPDQNLSSSRTTHGARL